MGATQLKVNTVVEIDPERLAVVKGNRAIDVHQLAKIKGAMSRENLLHVRPILINKEMQIIDGQHRVAAAIELGFKMVPCLVVQASVHDAPKINSIGKNWNLLNYASYWKAHGKPAYGQFIDFNRQTGIVPSVAIALLSGESQEAYAAFKIGNFKARNLGLAHKFVDALEGYGKMYPSIYKQRSFLRATWLCYRNSAYDHKRMMENLAEVPLKKTPFAAEYVKQLQTVFNYGAPVAARVVFEVKRGV